MGFGSALKKFGKITAGFATGGALGVIQATTQVTGEIAAGKQAKRSDTEQIKSGSLQIEQLWANLTGEQLSLWTPSKYPNVPLGPGGNYGVDVDVAIDQLKAIVDDTTSKISRQESLKNPFFTGPYFLKLFTQVQSYRLRNPQSVAGLLSEKTGLSKMALTAIAATLLLGGFGLYLVRR
jgi:hypothetical protein